MNSTLEGIKSLKRLRFLIGPITDEQRLNLLRSSQVSFLPMEAIGERGQLDLSGARELEEVKFGYTQLFDGNVVIAKITPCFENGKGALIQNLLNGVGFGTTELHVLNPGPQLEGRFLYYVTSSQPFRSLGEAVMTGAAGQKRVPEEFVHNYRIYAPPLPQQRAIADYLDRETAKLDALIAAKERLLGLLAEKRRALIARAVTRGLDPNVPLRNSGISWLGEIPKHWKVERCRWLFRERDERSESGEEDLLTVSHITGVTPRSEKDVNMFEAETTEGYKLCYAGDLVINTMWAWMGAMGVAKIDGIVSPSYNVYTPSSFLDPNYIDAIVRIPVFPQEVARYSKGVWSSRLRLYPEGFFEIWLPVPPLSEQQAIVAYIKKETAKLDALKEAAERTIVLLKERRTALISEAVTGKIDLHQTATPLEEGA